MRPSRTIIRCPDRVQRKLPARRPGGGKSAKTMTFPVRGRRHAVLYKRSPLPVVLVVRHAKVISARTPGPPAFSIINYKTLSLTLISAAAILYVLITVTIRRRRNRIGSEHDRFLFTFSFPPENPWHRRRYENLILPPSCSARDSAYFAGRMTGRRSA